MMRSILQIALFFVLPMAMDGAWDLRGSSLFPVAAQVELPRSILSIGPEEYFFLLSVVCE